MKIDELPNRKLAVEVKQGGKIWEIDLVRYLPYAGIESSDQIVNVTTSEYFPPEKYSNTGRTPHMPPSYSCMGSVSYKFLLKNEQERALSLALFHDTTRHGGIPEVNAWIYGWPVNIARPDYTKKVPCHSLHDDEPIEIKIARGTAIEKHITLKPLKDENLDALE